MIAFLPTSSTPAAVKIAVITASREGIYARWITGQTGNRVKASPACAPALLWGAV